MKSPKMNMLTICILGTLAMFEAISTYTFSFMDVPALLALCIFFISLSYFIDSWFYYGWGFFTGIVVFVPWVMAIFNQSDNIAAYIFDGLLSLFLLGYFGYKIYRKVYS